MTNRPRHFRRPASKGAFATRCGGRLRSRMKMPDPASPSAGDVGGATAPALAIIDPVTRRFIGWLTG